MKKSYLIIISVCVIYALVMFLIFNKKETDYTGQYLIIDRNILKYEENEWGTVEYNSQDTSNILFHVYKNNQYQGNYYLNLYNDKWYFFDKNNESHNLYGSLLAYNGDLDIDVESFEIEQATLNEVSSMLKDYDLSINNNSELTVNEKVVFDFDNDNEDEIIYNLSNITLDIDNANTLLFTLVIYQDNDKIQTVIDKKETISNSDNKFYTISNIIDLNNDKKYEIILKQEQLMNSSVQCIQIYQPYKNKQIKNC